MKIQCNLYDSKICYVFRGNVITFCVALDRVLHEPGLGPRAGPACSPWAGPAFYDILRAGPGAGLKLAGPGW